MEGDGVRSGGRISPMTADDDLRLIGMIRTLLTKLELERDAFEAAITLRPPKARRMSDEIRDTLRARTPIAAATSSEQDVSAAGDVAARSIQAIQMALEKKPRSAAAGEGANGRRKMTSKNGRTRSIG
jgi:hypothetical protein